MNEPPLHTPVDPKALRRKVAWRILPFVFLIYIFAYLDRANVGFAKLAMKEDLRFSEEVFGFGFGIFFIGYLVLEIPGALLVERWSARKWFARILISWGLCSALTALVQTPMQFYVARFLLGVAEAGFFPGIIVYFTHWFAGRDRARALSGLVMAVPFSLAMGAPVSALFLKLDWLGLKGWQWMFLLEGLPAVALGVITLFYLTDRPRDAQWLSAAERDHLQGTLDAEVRAKEAAGKATVWQALRMPTVWLLALGIFATNTGGYAMALWLPTTVKNLSVSSTFSAGDLVDLPSLASTLKQPRRAFDTWLAAQLSSDARAALADYQDRGSDPAPLQQALVKDFNRILSDSSFYEEQRFTEIFLRSETQTLRSRNPQGRELERFNRLLIEDAYPLEVTKIDLSGSSADAALFYSGLFYACGLISVFLAGQSSDRTGDRKWHCVGGQVAAALLLMLSTLPNQSFGVVMMWLCLAALGSYFWPTPFWALPTLTLTASAAAVSIGFINMMANLAGFLGNYNVGWLKEHGFDDRACLRFLASCYLLGGILISFVRVPKRPVPAQANSS